MTPGNDRCSFLYSHLLLSLAISPILIALAACSGAAGSLPRSTTAVTVLATSTADDRLTQFTMAFSGLSLISSTGKEVPIITSPIYTEFIHLNGAEEPLLTVNIPSGTYTSAKASVGFSTLYCIAVAQQGGLDGLSWSSGNVKSDKVSITLPHPIQVSGGSTAIQLNLLVGPSSSNGVCDIESTHSGVAPSFMLTEVTTDSTRNISNLQGVVQSINDDGSFTVSSIDGANLSYDGSSGAAVTALPPQWQVSPAAGAVFQGIHGVSDLQAGQPVDMDVTLQNGLLAAKRVSVYDTNAGHLSLFSGPLLTSNSVNQPVIAWARGAIGAPHYFGMTPFSVAGAKFGISSAFTNLAELPFSAKFDVSSFTWGQAVDVTTHQSLFLNQYLPVTTVTLVPQTINGAVQPVSTNGSFTEYTVSLASYDLFPQLALQWGQSGHLDSPAIITVYADQNTQSQTAVP